VPHPANTLNELSGEEWLYFTESVLPTAGGRRQPRARAER